MIGTFVFLALLIGLFTAQTMRVAHQRHEAERWHVHTLDALLLAKEFRAAAFGILRGERGYLLTGNEVFLKPYVIGRREAPPLLDRLDELVADNPEQLARVNAVRTRLDSYLAVLERTVLLKRLGRDEEALAIVRAGRGNEQLEGLQSAIDAFEAEERRLLVARRVEVDRYASWNELLGYGAAVLIVILLGIAALAAVFALKAQRRSAQATEELRRLATVDELTGLPNRRQFLARLEEETARARRNGSALCLATIDIDHFKRINDSHGHPGGDEVLRQMAAVIRDKIRLGDSPCRFGGEEFALLLPNTRPHQAHLVCDRLRAALAAHPIQLPGGARCQVTISTGVALLANDDTPEALIQRSDEALYDAKANGRNQVRLAA